MNPIKSYRKEKKLKRREFAALLGISVIHLYSMENYRRCPSLVLMEKIEAATNGQLTVQMLAIHYTKEVPSCKI